MTKRTRTARAAGILLLGMALSLGHTACQKQVGGACHAGDSTCANASAALTCRGGKFAPVTCKGPLGCTTFKGQARCDDSESSVGDSCMGGIEDEYACSPDKKRALLCDGTTFAPYLECRGEKGCIIQGRRVACDSSLATVGDVCKTDGAAACAAGLPEALTCREGKFVHHRFCRGPAGCQTTETDPTCDITLAREDDECSPGGLLSCATDRKQELVCNGTRFVKARACRTSCAVIAGGRGGVDCR